MDSKTKHRILGILVLSGLVIILLPFLQTNKELSSQAAIVKAPPFPDQSMQVTTLTPQVDQAATNNQPASQETTIPSKTPSPSPISSLSMTTPVVSQATANPGPDEVINNNHSDVMNIPSPAILNPMISTPDSSKEKSKAITKSDKGDIDHQTIYNVVEPEKEVASPKSRLASKQISAKIHRTAIKGPIDDNGLFKIQEAAWVIQVGNFKNKANALRIVNKLRANGYRAFIQRISSSTGENTQVFIGPESRQSAARSVAAELESDMHMRGIVISYKPLAS